MAAKREAPVIGSPGGYTMKRIGFVQVAVPCAHHLESKLGCSLAVASINTTANTHAMRLLGLCALALAAGRAHGYLDTAPFFMFSTSEYAVPELRCQAHSQLTIFRIDS
jgi:hypothetical protein